MNSDLVCVWNSFTLNRFDSLFIYTLSVLSSVVVCLKKKQNTLSFYNFTHSHYLLIFVRFYHAPLFRIQDGHAI